MYSNLNPPTKNGHIHPKHLQTHMVYVEKMLGSHVAPKVSDIGTAIIWEDHHIY